MKISSFHDDKKILVLISFLFLCALSMLMQYTNVNASWNSPNVTSSNSNKKTLYSSFSASPKHLDPVRSYSSNEWAIISQIYEPPLQYYYFKRPYELQPLTLKSMPKLVFLDKNFQRVSESQKNNGQFDYTRYDFELREDVFYQPHPAFAKNNNGYLYHRLDKKIETLKKQNNPEKVSELESIKKLSEFAKVGSRQLVADDYIYAIKRMAVRQNHSPILDTMKQYIVGLDAFSQSISQQLKSELETSGKSLKEHYFDLGQHGIKGVKKHSDFSFSILIKGHYPQFLYWMSMNFFAPIPWEAMKFYQQPFMNERNLTLDTSPVGTGPFYLAENNPNQRMRLVKNPNFHPEAFPEVPNDFPENLKQNYQKDTGKTLPLIDEVIYSLEKESVPLWNKFLQGYYDASGVSSDSFDQAISVSSNGNLGLTSAMKEKGIQFLNAIQPTIFYFGFNMADPTVGGYSEKQQKLRQAISIAINFEEYISIFLNGRGVAAQSPIPPGIFGHQSLPAGINSQVYHLDGERIKRKSLQEAKQLLADAGYPNGKKSDGTPLQLFYDTAATGPDSQSMLNWYRKQFAKLGIELVIRATDYNRFQDKVRGAKVQMFSWGWNADYPDPENFLFLLYGGNAAINTNGSGINSANYDNPEFNRLFKQIKTMGNSPERLRLIEQMIQIAQKDAPWAWGFYPKSLALYHSWLRNLWPNAMANNTLKYRNVDAQLRSQQQEKWNQPIVWPLWILFAILLISIWPLYNAYRKRQNYRVQNHQEESVITHSDELNRKIKES